MLRSPWRLRVLAVQILFSVFWLLISAPEAMGKPIPPPCGGIGGVCGDGSVYAGLSPDGNVAMYTTPADAGLYCGNNCNSGGSYTTTSQTSLVTGKANSAAIITFDSNDSAAGIQPHQAAALCEGLIAHGKSDWYLPASDELNVLWTNRVAIGAFNLTGSYPAGYYWSSSEFNDVHARHQRFSDGPQGDATKYLALSVRCVR